MMESFLSFLAMVFNLFDHYEQVVGLLELLACDLGHTMYRLNPQMKH
jgi:hypothetical protein